jgi:outer membrane protein assembly factor BamB
LRSGKWTSKGQYTETYETYFGKAEVRRYVYQSSEGGKTYCPLEEKAQLIEGATPKFAKTLSSKYAHLGVGGVTIDLLDNHGRSISATYVQRVSDAVGLLLTTKGERWQYALPDDLDKRSVKALSVGVDGTCVLAVEGGYKQAMAGTISGRRSSAHHLCGFCAGEREEDVSLENAQRAERRDQRVSQGNGCRRC